MPQEFRVSPRYQRARDPCDNMATHVKDESVHRDKRTIPTTPRLAAIQNHSQTGFPIPSLARRRDSGFQVSGQGLRAIHRLEALGHVELFERSGGQGFSDRRIGLGRADRNAVARKGRRWLCHGA